MATDTTPTELVNWKLDLPALTARGVVLREPTSHDLAAVTELLSAADGNRFGLAASPCEVAVRQFLEQVARDRQSGVAFTYLVTNAVSQTAVGLFQVRQLDPSFETAECEATIATAARGNGTFVDAALLVGSFLFHTVGAHRLECRVPTQNGRANGALRKLGAVEEGVLRRSLRRGGEYFDQVLWSLLKDDWRDHAASPARVH